MPRIITTESNNKLKREYRARFFIKLLITLCLVILLVAVFFVPSLGTLYFYEKSHSNVGGNDQKGDILKMNEEYDTKLEMTYELSKKVQVSDSNHVRIAEILSSYANGGMILDSLDFTDEGINTVVTIRGESQTREALLDFEQKIKSNDNFDGFEIPVDSLRKQNEILFNITFTYYEK